MGDNWDRWRWKHVQVIHRADGDNPSLCSGEVRSYVYRFYKPEDSFYERCVALSWCSDCREHSGAMVHVPRSEHLPDPLAELPADQRLQLRRSGNRLLEHLDRLARKGLWPVSN
jgi:hypothetical protein